MFRIRLSGAVLALSLMLGASSPQAQTRKWTALYAFGDSYTDSGAGYVDGNGPTAVVYLASRLGIAFTHAADPDASGKGLNFAVSGARTGSSDGVKMRLAASPCGVDEVLIRRGMRTQVADFARRVDAGSVRFDPETTLFFLAGGLNDGELPVEESIANIEDEIRTLHAKGARYFLVALLPVKIPEFAKPGVRLNPSIARIPADLRSLPAAHIAVSRWGAYFDRIRENPAAYGIRNASDRCAGRLMYGEDPKPCADPDAHFYYHSGHPSTAVQRMVARDMEREVAEAFP